MATSGSFSNHLAPGIREVIGTGFKGREAFYSMYYNVETSERKYEDYLAAAGLPMAGAKPEATPIVAYDPLEGDTKRFTHSTYALGFEVSREAWEDDLYAGKGSALRAAAQGIPDGMAERVEVEAHRPLGPDGFDVYTVLPDGSYLFDTGHSPVSGGEAADQANEPSTAVDLNVTSFRNALIEFEKYVNDRGLRIPAYTKPVRLIVPPALRYSAMEIVGSMWRPDTVNRVENVTKGAVSVSVTPYITDEDQWLIQASKHFMVFLWRRRPDFDSFDDRRSGVAVFVSTMRFVVAPVHWLGMYGCPGA